MKRFRLSTVMLLVVIAALGLALVVQDQRAKRREAALRSKLPRIEHAIAAPFTGIIYQHNKVKWIDATASYAKALEQLSGSDNREEGRW